MKRFVCVLFALLMAGSAAFAVPENFVEDSAVPLIEDGEDVARASKYIIARYASMYAHNPGILEIDISIIPNGFMTLLGASYIQIYEADGTYVDTIIGSTENGLLAENTGAGFDALYEYDEKVVSGQSYYAVVAIYAGNDTGCDVKMMVTPTVEAL